MHVQLSCGSVHILAHSSADFKENLVPQNSGTMRTQLCSGVKTGAVLYWLVLYLPECFHYTHLVTFFQVIPESIVVVPAWYLIPVKSLPTWYLVEILGNECTQMKVKLQYIMLVLQMYFIVSCVFLLWLVSKPRELVRFCFFYCCSWPFLYPSSPLPMWFTHQMCKSSLVSHYWARQRVMQWRQSNINLSTQDVPTGHATGCALHSL